MQIVLLVCISEYLHSFKYINYYYCLLFIKLINAKSAFFFSDLCLDLFCYSSIYHRTIWIIRIFFNDPVFKDVT